MVRPGVTALLGLALLLSPLAQAQADKAQSLLSALTRSAQFTVRGEANVTVLFPPRTPPTRLAGALPMLKVFPSLVKQNFEIALAGTQAVAGRSAQVFDVTPKVGAAARWRIWVDAVWNLPLAYEERSAQGTLTRRAELVRADKRQSRAPAAVQTLSAAPLPGLPAALQRALPGLKLPPGFRAVSVGQRKAGPEVILSDGLNVAALVLAPRGVKAAQGVASRRVGNQFIWLVGNLDPQTLAQALSGITRSDLSALGTFLPPPDSNP